MGLLNRWTSKKEADEAREKRDASVIKKVEEVKQENTQPEVSAKPAVKKEIKKETEKNAAVSGNEIKFKEGHKVLLRPVVTEKSTYLHSNGVYAFEVGILATKPEIKKAVEAIYKVKVVQIRIINLQGKRVRFGRMSGVRKDKKKAMVTLQKGQTIELHKNV